MTVHGRRNSSFINLVLLIAIVSLILQHLSERHRGQVELPEITVVLVADVSSRASMYEDAITKLVVDAVSSTHTLTRSHYVTHVGLSVLLFLVDVGYVLRRWKTLSVSLSRLKPRLLSYLLTFQEHVLVGHDLVPLTVVDIKDPDIVQGFLSCVSAEDEYLAAEDASDVT